MAKPKFAKFAYLNPIGLSILFVLFILGFIDAYMADDPLTISWVIENFLVLFVIYSVIAFVIYKLRK